MRACVRACVRTPGRAAGHVARPPVLRAVEELAVRLHQSVARLTPVLRVQVRLAFQNGVTRQADCVGHQGRHPSAGEAAVVRQAEPVVVRFVTWLVALKAVDCLVPVCDQTATGR